MLMYNLYFFIRGIDVNERNNFTGVEDWRNYVDCAIFLYS